MADPLAGLHTHFQIKGENAFRAGKSRDSHDLNPGSIAIADFHIGYDAASISHHADSLTKRVDARQVAA